MHIFLFSSCCWHDHLTTSSTASVVSPLSLPLVTTESSTVNCTLIPPYVFSKVMVVEELKQSFSHTEPSSSTSSSPKVPPGLWWARRWGRAQGLDPSSYFISFFKLNLNNILHVNESQTCVTESSPTSAANAKGVRRKLIIYAKILYSKKITAF